MRTDRRSNLREQVVGYVVCRNRKVLVSLRIEGEEALGVGARKPLNPDALHGCRDDDVAILIHQGMGADIVETGGNIVPDQDDDAIEAGVICGTSYDNAGAIGQSFPSFDLPLTIRRWPGPIREMKARGGAGEEIFLLPIFDAGAVEQRLDEGLATSALNGSDHAPIRHWQFSPVNDLFSGLWLRAGRFLRCCDQVPPQHARP